MNSLIYRRQFLLIDKPVPQLGEWEHEEISNSLLKLQLYIHPDLNCYRGRNELFELVLLGYILDPHNPSYTDEDILKILVKHRSLPGLLQGIEQYNGRFVLLYIAADELNIVNDAVGFREVYYHLKGDTVSIGSTPDIVAAYTGIERTEDKDMLAYYHSDKFIESQNTWLGTRTLFQDIRQLLPNHYLDVIKKDVLRFWPDERIERIGLDECAEQCAAILKGTLESAVNRYDIHMGITAGWDTRLLLSSARTFRDRIFFYVNKPASITSDHRDIKIPLLLAGKLGFNLNIIEISDEIDREFESVFYSNNVLARDIYLPLFHEVYTRGWQNTYTLSGTMGNGLARIYMRIPAGMEINGENIARVSHFHKLKYAVEALDQWAGAIRDSLEDWNVDIMDLYQLEQENSHWASLSSSEQDIVRDEIRPFNNRQLIKLCWSLDERHRYQYYPGNYIRIMQLLWKEVLDYPINPSRRTSFYRVLRIFGIEQRVFWYGKRRQFLKS